MSRSNMVGKGIFAFMLATTICWAAAESDTSAFSRLNERFQSGMWCENEIAAVSNETLNQMRPSIKFEGDKDSKRTTTFFFAVLAKKMAQPSDLEHIKKRSVRDGATPVDHHLQGLVLQDQKHYKEALKEFKLGAKGGYADSMFRVGFYWSSGWLGETDYKKAKKHLQSAADKGQACAQDCLATLIHAGKIKGKKKDVMKLFQKAAQQGLPNAMNNYGMLRYIEGNRAEGLELVKKAATAGNQSAINNLRSMS